jgi:hypothetical protein
MSSRSKGNDGQLRGMLAHELSHKICNEGT